MSDKPEERKGMSREELEHAVDDALLKKVRGERLDEREQLILAYSYHAAGCRSCGRHR